MRRERLALGVAVLGLWCFYVGRAAPSITIGDAAELSAAGGTLGIAHSPGYPLYVITSRLGHGFIPFAGTAYRTNVLSAFWTAASIGLIGLSLLEITGSLIVSLFMAMLLGLAPLWMGQALVTEVFGLNSFFAALLLNLSLNVHKESQACLIAYGWGLGMGNNHTLLLVAPALGIACWPLIRKQQVSLLVKMIGFGLLGLSLYVFIPIRAHRLPLMNWEEPATWERFWKLFMRARYGAFQLAQGHVSELTWDDLKAQIGYIASVLWHTWGLLSVAFLVSLWGWRKAENRRSLLIVAAAFFFSGPFFFLWSHIPVNARTRFILDRFMYLPLVPAALLVGAGWRVIAQALRDRNLPEWGGWIAVGLLVGLTLRGARWPNERGNLYVHDLGMDLLRSAPPNTLLFVDRADEAEFSLAYLQRAEGRRPDVKFIDCNAGVSPSIYGSNYYDIWGRPRLAIRTVEERQRIATWNGPVYYATHEPQMIPIPRIQQGLLFAVPVRGFRKSRLPWNQILTFRHVERASPRKGSWDRGLYSDYLYMLSQDAYQAGGMPHYLELYHGAELYAQR
jgi:hypothetical protein